MTVREIQGYLEEMYGIEVSPDFISQVTEAVMAEVLEWQSRPLERLYPVVFFDCLRVKIRDEGVVRNKAIYLALGVLPGGTQAQSLIVNGNSQFTGAVTLTSVTGAVNNAILTLKGASNVATAGIAMVEGAASTNRSTLNFTGTVAQTLTGGDISTGTAAVGLIQVNNSAGVTIANTVGVTGGNALAVTIDKGVGNSSATFQNTTNAPITLGAAAGTVAGVTYGVATAGDTNTVTFDSTTQSFTVTGAIAGANATQTNNVVASGGKTVTLATATGTNLNNITVTGANTVLATGFNMVGATTNLVMSNGGTLKTTANAPVLSGIINNTGGTLDIATGTTASLALTNTGTIFVEANKTLTATLGMVDTSAGAIKIGMAAGTFGVIAEGAGAVDLSHAAVSIAGTSITPGTYAVFTGTAGTGVVPLSLTSAFFTPTATVVGSGVSITIAAKTLTGNQTLATSILASGAMQTAIGGAGGRAMLAISNAGSPADLDNALASVRPTVDGSTTTTVMDVGSQVHGVADTRMAALHNGDGLTGMAAGSSANGVSMWLQGYGQSAIQNARGGVAGYDSKTLGGVIGVDSTRMINDGVLGVSFNYGRTTAESKNANTTGTDVDSYGFGIYGSHDIGNQMFVNGQVGYAYNKYNSTRHNVLAVGDFANGDYSGNMYSAKLAFGRDYAMDHGLTLTPTVSADYAHLNNDAYSETGTAAGGLMNVNSNSTNAFDLGLGLNAGWKFKNADGSAAKPSLHANYTYDASDKAVQTTATYQGALGNAFTTQGPTPSRSKFDFGAGIVYSTTANWDLSADYDFSWKEQYTAHNGMLRATSHF